MAIPDEILKEIEAQGQAYEDHLVKGLAEFSADHPVEGDAVEAKEPFALEPQPVPAPPPEPRKVSDKDKEKAEASQSPFSVTVGLVYDGPMDLLLDLIRRQNIDIYDIPMAQITAQFLEYTHHLKETDVDAAGEFIYVASLLIHIKSKTLLPRDPSDVTGADAEDPRRELVERLLEHERFKAAAQMLMQKQLLEDATWSQPGMKGFLRDAGLESTDDERDIAATVPDFPRVMAEILRRAREFPVHNVDEESVTVRQMIDYLKRSLLWEDKPISLERLTRKSSERGVICIFLAILELVRLQAILLRQSDQLADILIKKTDHFDQVFEDQAAVRDDWS